MATRYERVRDLGAGNFGHAVLVKDRLTGELVAIKYIERGDKIDKNVEREIINHRTLNHPNIIGFKEVGSAPGIWKPLSGSAYPLLPAFRAWGWCRGCLAPLPLAREMASTHPAAELLLHLQVFLTNTHLAIVMEYAAGGELFERIVKAGRFSEAEARYFFQQLISGVDYCHRSVGPVGRTGCRDWGIPCYEAGPAPACPVGFGTLHRS